MLRKIWVPDRWGVLPQHPPRINHIYFLPRFLNAVARGALVVPVAILNDPLRCISPYLFTTCGYCDFSHSDSSPGLFCTVSWVQSRVCRQSVVPRLCLVFMFWLLLVNYIFCAAILSCIAFNLGWARTTRFFKLSVLWKFQGFFLV